MKNNYKKFTIDLARKAGRIVNKNFTLGMKKQWKDDNTPLTVADLEINKLVIDSVKEKFPEHSVLGEEESHQVENSEFVWVCDPIDGTIPFSHGVPISSFSLALVQNGKPILGIIYDSFLDRMWFAEKGKGAFLNNKKILVSSCKNLQRSPIAIANWHKAKFDLRKVTAELVWRDAFVFCPCSTVYFGGLVASGEFIVSIFAGESPWDFAAVKIIVEEAGGKVTDLMGNEQKYNQKIKGGIASNGIVHDELLKIIQKNIKN